MLIRHSNQLLEHLSEVESKIQLIEKLMEELHIEGNEEQLIRALLARNYGALSGQ